MIQISLWEDSKYLRKFRPYFITRARYDRDADTIVLFVFLTPTGKWSKYWATLRFNSERSHKNMRNQIQEYYEQLIGKTFKREIAKGYSLGEVILYSGKLNN